MCRKCQGLVFFGNTDSSGAISWGRCPLKNELGNSHDPSVRYNFALEHGIAPSRSKMQSGWRWCRKCEGLFFAFNAGKGRCPAKGAHDKSQSGDYNVEFEYP